MHHIKLIADFLAACSRNVAPASVGGSTARRSREQLNAEFRLKPSKPSADERFGNAKPARCRCETGGVSNLHEGAQFLNIHWCFLFGDMACQSEVYRAKKLNGSSLQLTLP